MRWVLLWAGLTFAAGGDSRPMRNLTLALLLLAACGEHPENPFFLELGTNHVAFSSSL